MCRKPSTLHLVNRLKYSNLLGLDVNLKNGRLASMIWKFTYYYFLCILPIEIKKTRKKKIPKVEILSALYGGGRRLAISELKTC